MRVNFTLEKETKGALQYKECDSDGNVRAINDGAVIGTLYIRKSTFKKGNTPQAVQVDLTWPGGDV